MFANNDQISWKQMYCQMVLALLGALLVCLPGEGEIYGLPGAFAGILSLVVLIVYCFYLVRLVPSYTHLSRYVGVVGQRIAGGIFLSYFVMSGAFLVTMTVDIILIYMNAMAEQWMIALLAVLACGCVGTMEVQGRGRMAEVLFPFLIGGLGVMVVMAFSQNRGDFTNYLMQRTYVDVDTILGDVYKILSICACVGATPFVLGNVRDRRYISLVGALGVIFLFLLGAVILIQGSYGLRQTIERDWPMLSVMASIRIPDGFVSRMDPIWVSLLLMLLLFSLGSSFFYGNHIVKKTDLRIPWYVIGGLVYVISQLQMGGKTIQELYLPMVELFFAPILFIWNVYLGIRVRWVSKGKKREVYDEK